MPSRADAIVVALLLTGCGAGETRLGESPRAYAGYDATGLASWYGEEMAGRRTASGKRFDPAALTLAHRFLPFGTLVEVTALDTGRAIVARVTDRGPRRADRLIDLSRGAARLLGTDRGPLGRVRVRALPPGTARPSLIRAGRSRRQVSEMPAPGRYLLQVASFSDEERARALADRLGGEVVRIGSFYSVRLGGLPDTAAAQRARDAVAAQSYADATLILLP